MLEYFAVCSRANAKLECPRDRNMKLTNITPCCRWTIDSEITIKLIVEFHVKLVEFLRTQFWFLSSIHLVHILLYCNEFRKDKTAIRIRQATLFYSTVLFQTTLCHFNLFLFPFSFICIYLISALFQTIFMHHRFIVETYFDSRVNTREIITDKWKEKNGDTKGIGNH